MTIAAQLIALAGIKANLLAALQAKGSTADGATPFADYIAEIDALVGGGASDPDWGLVTLASHCDSVTADLTGKTLTAYGNAAVSAAQSVFAGGQSWYLDGTGDYIVPGTAIADTAYGTGNFCIECWVYPTANISGKFILDGRPAAANGNHISIAGGASTNVVRVMINGSWVATGATALPLNAWSHIAAERSNGTLRLNVNYLQDAITGNSTDLVGVANRPAIGCDGSSLGSGTFQGHIALPRITKAVRVAALPAAAFPTA